MRIIQKIVDFVIVFLCYLIFILFCDAWTQLIIKFPHIQLLYRYLWIYGIFLFLPTATSLPFVLNRSGHIFSWLKIGIGAICALLAFLNHLLFGGIEGIGFTILTMSCIIIPWGLFFQQNAWRFYDGKEKAGGW